MVVLDAHALPWWALDPDRLSGPAVAALAAMEQRGGCASAISIWELGVEVKRGQLELGIPIEALARRIEAHSPVELVVWLRGLALAWDHRDPADRVIVATALVRGLPIVTRDEAIERCGLVDTIW